MLHLQEAAALQRWLEHRIERCHRQRRRGLQGADESLTRQLLLLKVLKPPKLPVPRESPRM